MIMQPHKHVIIIYILMIGFVLLFSKAGNQIIINTERIIKNEEVNKAYHTEDVNNVKLLTAEINDLKKELSLLKTASARENTLDDHFIYALDVAKQRSVVNTDRIVALEKSFAKHMNDYKNLKLEMEGMK